MNFKALALAALTLLSTAACSSGGGGAPAMAPQAPTSPPPPPPPPPNFNTTEYQTNGALAQVKAISAYEAGGAGAGVIVSIIDTGIDVNNAEFAGRIHPQSADLVRPGVVPTSEYRPGGPDLQDVDGHGTAVAGILGAAKNDVGMHGLAFDATLLVFRGDSESDSDKILGQAISEGLTRSINLGAKVLNLSLGSDEAGARDDFRHFLSRSAANDIVVAIAAGNDATADPEKSALAAADPQAAGTAMVVGAVTSGNNIASFSNHAGVAAQFFIVAPGTSIRTPGIGGGLVTFSGTSAATPFAAAAAAILRDLWPQLTAAEVVDILLSTATDLGAPGVDPIYGRGLLNLQAAVQPLGGAATTSVGGAALSVDETAIAPGPAYGARAPDFGDFVFLDGYGRDFRTSLNALSRARPDLRADPILAVGGHRRAASGSFAAGDGAMLLRIVDEDLGLTKPATAFRAPAGGIGARDGDHEERLAFALSQPAGRGATYIVATGFSAREVDGFLGGAAPQGLSRDGFADGYLLDREALAASAASIALDSATRLDALASYGEAAPVVDRHELWTSFEARAPIEQANFRIALSRRAADGDVRFEVGVRQERRGLFGAALGGVFGSDQGSTTYYQAGAFDLPLTDRWRAHGRAAIGLTRTSADGARGFLAGVDGFVSTQFAFGAYRNAIFARGDRLFLSVSQPLRIESGEMRLIIPAYYDIEADALVFAERRVGLGGARREIDFEAGYSFALPTGGVIEANLLRQTNVTAEGGAATMGVIRAGFGF
ncbi:MAG: S8 family peptidase [Amphiplicatus sp.]